MRDETCTYLFSAPFRNRLPATVVCFGILLGQQRQLRKRLERKTWLIRRLFNHAALIIDRSTCQHNSATIARLIARQHREIYCEGLANQPASD